MIETVVGWLFVVAVLVVAITGIVIKVWEIRDASQSEEKLR